MAINLIYNLKFHLKERSWNFVSENVETFTYPNHSWYQTIKAEYSYVPLLYTATAEWLKLSCATRRARNAFALQRNLEWGKCPSIGLNIVLAFKPMSQVIQQRLITTVCWFTLFSQKVIPKQKKCLNFL